MSTTARIKRQLAIYGGSIGVALALVGVLMIGAGGWMYLNPPVEEIPPEETNVQDFEASLDHSAVTTGNTSLYEAGERLRNQPVYFANSTPAVTFSTDVSVPEGRPVDVTQRILITHSATFNDEVFWERSVTLAEANETVEGGQTEIETTVRMTDIEEQRTTIEEVVGTIGTVSSELEMRVEYASPIDGGGTYEGTLETTSPIQFSGNAFWFDTGLSASETRSQTGQAEVRELPPDMTRVGGLAGGGLLVLVVGIALAVWSSREAEVYELELEVYRSRYDEWISEGEFPTDAANRYVYINSLKDLVDIAIDTNKRVIYDSDVDAYSVLDGEVVYYHAAEPRSVTSWLDA